MRYFDYLNHLLQTDDTKIAYLIAMIAVAMIMDYFTGVYAAWSSHDIDFRSKEGINGIVRKLASLLLLVFCVPISVLLPIGTGVAGLYVLYIGYLFAECTSILENLKKLGVNIGIFEVFLGKLKKDEVKEEDK